MSNPYVSRFAGIIRRTISSAKQPQRRRKAERRSTAAEVVEARTLLSAVSFESGSVSFAADPDVQHDVTVSSPDADTLVIAVGNGDTITLGNGASGNANFVLSDSDSVLTIDVATASVTDVEFELGNLVDSLTVEGLASGFTFSVDGGEGDDTIDASGADSSVVLVGGTGNDLLIGGSANDALIGGSGDDELRGGDGDDNLVGGGQIEVTVTNLQQTNGALLTPFFLATQNGQYDVFDVGSAASADLESLAEDGDTGPRIAAALGSGGVNQAITTPGGPLAPGESRTVSLRADSLNDLTQYLSFASMVIPSNDAFIGNDDPTEIDLFDANGDLIRRVGNDAFFVTGDDVYDAGTEDNDEIPANTAALEQAAPNTGVTENGVIAQHSGFIGSVGLGGTAGNILTANPAADFTDGNPQVASIQIDANDGNDLLIGGSGNDTLTGGDGNDTVFGGFGDDDIDGGAGDDTLIGGGQIEVTVTNNQPANGALLTPFFLATTDGSYDFFDVGAAASPGLESLAEDGATGSRITAALASGGVNAAIATSGGPIAPGESRTVTFYADPSNPLTQNLSFASMFIPSNDAFIGNDDPALIPLFDEDGNLIVRTGADAFTVTGENVYDAGTEDNDEIPANTAALEQAAPNTGVTENGVIAQHSGFIGSVGLGGTAGNILTANPGADFTDGNPAVASIQIGGTLDGNDTINGGSGNDTIDGSEGDDTLFGEDGVDTINGGVGDDTIAGGSENDILNGGDGNDTVFGGFGDDDIDGGAGDDTLVGGGQIEVTVTNLQPADGGLLTPFVLATQNDTYDFFDVGSAASPNLEALAEDGNTAPRISAALGSGGVDAAVATPGGPIAPGESRTVTFYADPSNPLTQNLSFVSMFIPSNDAFIGNDDPTAISIFDTAGDLIVRTGGDAFVITGDSVYDAGTEVNDEIPANTAALEQAAPNTGVTEGGTIRQHEGFQGSSRLGGTVGNILTARPNADFTDGDPQVASIQIGTTLDGNDTINGGAGNDNILGSEGDDTLLGGGGTDAIDGGLGNDTNSFAGIGIGVTATVNADGSGTAAYGAVNETFAGIENLTGSDNDDVLTATGFAANILDGGAGDDTLNGGGGNDTLTGGPGNDTAEFAGAPSEYVVSSVSGGTQVADTQANRDGTDLLTDNIAQDFQGAASVPIINAIVRFPGARPTITWSPVTGATSYEVWVGRISPTQSRVLIGESIVSDTEFTPSADLDPASYRVWVRETGGAWSRSVEFEVQPNLVGPVTPVIETRPQFEWEAIPGATGYQIFIRTRDNSIGTNGDIIVNNIPANQLTFTPNVDLPEGAIRWWIRAENSRGNTGWSDVGITSVGGRAQVLSGNATTIAWTPVEGAGRYILHVENAADRTVVIREDNLTGTSFTAASALAAGNYRAWVKAIDAVTNDFAATPWSFPFDFTVAESNVRSDADNDLDSIDGVLTSFVVELDEAVARNEDAAVRQEVANTDRIRRGPAKPSESTKNDRLENASMEANLIDALLSDPAVIGRIADKA